MINYYYIEGQTPIDEEEKRSLIPVLTTVEELNEFEQENITIARKWMLKKIKQGPKLRIEPSLPPTSTFQLDIFTVGFLTALHKKMFDKTWKWAGMIRKSNKNIGCNYFEIHAQLKQLNDDANFWLQNSVYPIKKLALVYHHRLVKIHLFPNGNGRHARLVADAITRRYEVSQDIEWRGNNNDLSLNSANELRKQYINSLKEADRGNYKSLFGLFC